MREDDNRVQPPPIANFTYLPKELHENEMVIFVSSSMDPDGKTVSWEWYFGDGGEGLGENTPIRTQEGNYTVTLLVYDDEGETDWCFQTISVKRLEEKPMQYLI
ncbi:MAG: PKD domain-containing protein [Candidatus Brockarchaeota archaeon]|nr:PKD domain-containing protein [Candidatus Brockarchaeota archaeon]